MSALHAEGREFESLIAHGLSYNSRKKRTVSTVLFLYIYSGIKSHCRFVNVAIQQQSYKRQKKANDELSSTARNYFFLGIASFIFGIVILFTAEGSIPYFLLNSTFILSWIFAIYLVFKSVVTIFKLTYDEFCPKCGSVANKEIKDSTYINTTAKRKDGQDDLRYNKTGYTNNTYHYVCSKCSWSSMNNPRPADYA